MAMALPPVPEPRDLLPPLLACLPTTFTSARPPPALLPLLAPTLRQRIQYLGGSSSADGWVTLLNWDPEQASRLPALVENLDLEPHPVSGEVEIDDVRTIKYRRLDEETLHARLEVDQFDLLPVYVWCENDEHGQTGPGWKLAELKSMDDIRDEYTWYTLAKDANDAYVPQDIPRVPSAPARNASIAKTEGDEDDYWAAYDATPGHTPALEQASKKTAAPGGEEDYYARYGTEVQPALDSHDPDEEIPGESTLVGTQERGRPLLEVDDRPDWEKALYPRGMKLLGPQDSAHASAGQSVIMPRPISPASSSRSVERLEEQAAAMSEASNDSSGSRAGRGIRQHISTDIKSLFRLAKSAGMSRKSFEALIKRELDVLSILDDDE